MSMESWRLSDLFKNEEALESYTQELEEKSLNFSKMYRGNFKHISSVDFLEALKEYERIQEGLAKVMTYAYLKFATDSDNGAFYAKYAKKYTQIDENLLFFELEFNKLTKAKQDEIIMLSSDYTYYLKSLQEYKSHQLTQKEERILLKTSILGKSAFTRLFDEYFSNLTFSYNGKKCTQEEVLSLLYSSDQQTRKSAANALTKGLKPHQKLLSYIFNMVKKDLALKCELRGYKDVELPRHKENKISKKSVDALVNATQKEYNIVHQYYEIKREILGLDKLYDYDRYAPLYSDENEFSYESSKKVVLKAFMDFSPVFGNIAKRAFEEQWIDVYPKDKKRGGAFSHPSVSSVHPYVLLNYTNKRRDLFTVAHELGHAIHQQLSYSVGYLGSDTPLTTAETASIFAEMLAFDALKSSLNKKEKISLLAGKLEDIFATLFRQVVFTAYERKVHAHEGELSEDDFNAYWMEENKKMFGKSVTLGKGYQIWWSYIPHFIHSPFYCYAYSYGQLLVLALYGLYKSKECENFVDIYIQFLSLGGSKSPATLVKMFGFDIEDEKFWNIGLREVKDMFDEFVRLQNA